MKVAILLSTAIHGLILTYVAVIRPESEIFENLLEISGPEVISLEKYCKLGAEVCASPESSSAIKPIADIEQDFSTTSTIDLSISESPQGLISPEPLRDISEKDKLPQLEMEVLDQREDFNEDLKPYNELKSEGNEQRLDIVTLSNKKPPPRNSQRITDIASNSSQQIEDSEEKSVSLVIQEGAVEFAEEKAGSKLEESSVEITLEGQTVEAALSAAPNSLNLPPSRPNIIEKQSNEIRTINYGDLITDALDQIPNIVNDSLDNEKSNASDNYTLFKVEQSVRSVYNTAVLSGLAEPEKYKVRVKFFVNSTGVKKTSIVLLEPSNPSGRHLISFKAAKNAIIRALKDKTNYISREKYPSGINIILNFTPSLGVGYE